MARRRWSRRRDDDRVAKKPQDYALVQAVEDDPDLMIPDFRETLTAGESDGKPEDTAPEIFEDFTDTNPLPAPTAPTENAPRVFALVGATGGVGTTSLSTQIAHELAISLAQGSTASHRPTDPRVCLIDLDFENGACAHHLDLLPSLTIEDLSGPPEQIDKAFTLALVSTHECGVSLLAAPNTIGANARVNPRTIMAMLDAAAELYEYVIIDMPRYRQPWSLSVMRAVDVLNVTCELTIPSLHAARETLSRLAQEANGAVNAQAVVSKYERRSFKNTLKLGDAETALGRDVFATICLDPDTTRDALNCGEPAGAIRAESRFVKDVRKLTNALRTQRANPLSKAA